MEESELSKSLKFALFLLGLFSFFPILVGGMMLIAAMMGLVSHQAHMTHLSSDVGISNYKSYFAMTGIGWALYLLGRIINFIGFVIEAINLQKADQNYLKNKLCTLGQEACFVLTFTGVAASILSLIDSIALRRPLGYYTVVIAWLVIIIICLTVIYFLKKQMTPKTEKSNE